MRLGIPYAEVVGDPIAHSKSPIIHRFWLEKLGIDADYRACHVRADELDGYLKQRRADPFWLGCNVTSPHKQKVLGLVDDVTSRTREIGAANCIVKIGGGLLAENTDSAGVDRALPGVHDSVCLIGPGAARAAIPSLDIMGALDIRIVVRDAAKARSSLQHLDYDFNIFDFADAAAALDGVDGVINASPLGMVGQPEMPQTVLTNLTRVARGGYAFDMVYAPQDTALLRQARSLGLTAIDGLVMLMGQASSAFPMFFGLSAPRRLDAKLRALLTR